MINKELSKCCGVIARFRAVTKKQYGNPNTPYCSKCGKPFEVAEEEKKCCVCSGKLPSIISSGTGMKDGHVCFCHCHTPKYSIDNDWEKEFDDEIEKLNNIYYGNNGYREIEKYLSSPNNKLCANETYPETFYELDIDKIKNFISTILSKNSAKVKEETIELCVKKIEEITDLYDAGYDEKTHPFVLLIKLKDDLLALLDKK